MNILKSLGLLFDKENIAFSKNISFGKKVCLLDVGARDGIGWPWCTAQNNTLNVILVEPDPIEAKALEDQNQGCVLPYALWNEETELTLNINNSPGTSSVFKPNMPFLQQFEDSQRFEAREEIIIQTKTIDTLAQNKEIDSIDFVKIDVQGGELAILQGGEDFFKKNLVGLEVEVEFCPMYRDQPLFSDVDYFARVNLGLELWDIRKTYWKYSQHEYRMPLKVRLIFGDALYLRPVATLDFWLSSMDKKKSSQKFHALVVTTIAYGFLDYTSALINSDFSENYINKEDKEVLIKHISKISKSFYPFSNGNKYLYRIFQVLMHSFKPTYHGWANAEQHIGSKKTFNFWV